MQKQASTLTRLLVFSAVCAAMSVIVGKLLQIPVGNSVRISFESLPILFCSLTCGSLWGGLAGVVADLVGCAIMGYEINPIITLGMCLVGVLPALFSRPVKAKRSFASVLIPVFLTHVVANMCVKSFGLWLYYTTPLPFLLLRVAVFAVVGVLESVILYQVLAHTSITSFMKRS